MYVYMYVLMIYYAVDRYLEILLNSGTLKDTTKLARLALVFQILCSSNVPVIIVLQLLGYSITVTITGNVMQTSYCVFLSGSSGHSNFCCEVL